MHRSFMAIAILSLMAVSSARAEWFEARTNHFSIYIDDTEEGARAFAMRLERFDLALRLLYNLPDNPDRHATPVKVFALRDVLFQKACGCGMQILGWYTARVGGSVIFTAHMPDSDKKAQPGSWSSQMVLLHEYGHHFLYSNYPLAYPYWYSEGFAEFNANVIFNDDASVTVGIPAHYRAEALKSGGKLSVKEFFEPNSYGFGSRSDLIYARGWLLTHYLVLHPKRKGQLAIYLAELNRGKRSLDAAKTAFGDLDTLYRELLAYAKVPLAPPLRVPAPTQPIEVRVTKLSKGRAEMMPIHAVSTRGLPDGVRMGHAMRARGIASRYPDDPFVQVQLAEAEYDADNLDRADAAADRALAVMPTLVDALVYKGMIAVQRARKAKAPVDAATWSAARRWYLKANRVESNAALPLYLYYASFAAAKAKPSADAAKGLSRAVVLSPEGTAARWQLARQMLEEGDGTTAHFLLQPLAYRPHRKIAKNVPLDVIKLIEADKLAEAKARMEGEAED